jgi:putative DNA methylase
MIGHRFIEESFPVKEVGEVAAQEKNNHHAHINTLHTWWARRPLAASRATAYAALTPTPADIEDWQRRRNFLIALSKWERPLNSHLLARARKEILEASEGRSPRVLDPFAGGGSYPLEALRLGCETYASDYNPVAVLILKATLEYPQRFGPPISASNSSTEAPDDTFDALLTKRRVVNPLLEAVERWGNWVLEEARKELARYYPAGANGSIPVAYIWARAIPCQNPACGAEIPIMLQLWLAKKDTSHVALYPDISDGGLRFRIVGDGHDPWPQGFDPDRGTVSNGVATCLLCGTPVDDKTVRRLFHEHRTGQQMVAVVSHYPRRQGKIYRVATPEDESIYCEAGAALQQKRERLMLEWGLDPIPDEPISKERPSPNARGASGLTRFEINTWGDLFNLRQRLTLTTITEKVRDAYERMVKEGVDAEFATAVVTYLALALDKLATFQNALTRWNVGSTSFAGKPDQGPSLEMKWDYAESNPLSTVTGSFANQIESIVTVLGSYGGLEGVGKVISCSATNLPFADEQFDAVLTDPPYYDNIPYSHLSDFFYVWLKRAVGHLYPDLFSTPLTPKAGEIVAYTRQEGGFEAGKSFFEENLKRAFKEMHRVLKSEGIAVIVYAHKSTGGWEAVINALLDSSLVITSAWPINTERRSRLIAKETAALASSIYIVARKIARLATGFYNEVREELRDHLDAKLQRLWEEGIGGADFFIAAIGSAIEVFGKYEQVLDYEGNIVRADRLLDEVRTIATDYAVRQILHNGFASEISDLTRFYVLSRWNYGEARVSFDEARKLAQSCGLDLTREWGRNGFIRKDKEFVQVLGPQVRKLENLEEAHELIDVLHRVLLLWEKSRRTELAQALATSGYGQSEAFYRVAQAISETLPNESKEKKLLDGFLAGRERVREDVGRIAQQRKLWEE